MSSSRRVSRCCLFLLATMLALGAASTASAQLAPPRYVVRPGLTLIGSIAAPNAILSARNNGSGYGLYGIATGPLASGVRGLGLGLSVGVSARSDTGTGVLAYSDSGYALWAQQGSVSLPPGFGPPAAIIAASADGPAIVAISVGPAALQVVGGEQDAAEFWGYSTLDPVVKIWNNGPNRDALKVHNGAVAAVNPGPFDSFRAGPTDQDASQNFRVTATGDVYAGDVYAWSFTLRGSDFAEPFALARGTSHPGTVLVLSREAAGKVVLSSTPYSTAVVGVHSTQPGVMGGGSGASKKGAIPVALLGVVPCQVSAENGAIAPADLLVTSRTPGYAMKGTDRSRMLGAVLGKALEPLAKGKGTINVLLCAR